MCKRVCVYASLCERVVVVRKIECVCVCECVGVWHFLIMQADQSSQLLLQYE